MNFEARSTNSETSSETEKRKCRNGVRGDCANTLSTFLLRDFGIVSGFVLRIPCFPRPGPAPAFRKATIGPSRLVVRGCGAREGKWNRHRSWTVPVGPKQRPPASATRSDGWPWWRIYRPVPEGTSGGGAPVRPPPRWTVFDHRPPRRPRRAARAVHRPGRGHTGPTRPRGPGRNTARRVAGRLTHIRRGPKRTRRNDRIAVWT